MNVGIGGVDAGLYNLYTTTKGDGGTGRHFHDLGSMVKSALIIEQDVQRNL